ncbi:MAG: GAF and ANTAR domain-containing protein [Nitriliruptoraceae bacterium]|nr:GAF and ANTAR domain-containing protein [Nitriliruptoraceae bacterium]
MSDALMEPGARRQVDRPRLVPGPSTGVTVGDGYVGTLERLTGLLVEDETLESLLTQVLELTSRAIGTSAAVSVTAIDDGGGYVTVAATSEDARVVDDLQYELDEGPCVDSLQTGREHLLSDLSQEERWPAFRERAMDCGFGSVFSVPLRAGGQPIGALNVFAGERGALRADDLELARRIAAPAATTLANARAYRQATQLAGQLQQALEGRAVIERAKGILMASRPCDEEEAFGLLRRASQQRNVKLRDIAQAVIADPTTLAR